MKFGENFTYATPERQPESEWLPDRVVVLLKPSGTEHEHDLLEVLESHGLDVVKVEDKEFTEELLRTFYPGAEQYMKEMTAHYATGTTVALEVVGPQAMEICLQLKRHIRVAYGLKAPADAMHSSDEPAEVEREWQVVFGTQPE